MTRILVTGICGFVGSTLARRLLESLEGVEIVGIDNLIRPGSESNRSLLKRLGVRIFHGDIRSATDFEILPPADWVVDAAANPSVLAGVDGRTSSRQLLEHNLLGTVNILEYCRRHDAGFILLSTSRVYSIPPLAALRVVERDGAFVPDPDQTFPEGLSPLGVAESFSTSPPVSLYGSTKLASETIALEYGETFGFPVWIDRCGVLAGAGQFGRPDQGIFSFWINSWISRRPLSCIGFGGTGRQVRDCLHPRDLVPLLIRQMNAGSVGERIVNLGGGVANAISLAQLCDWCRERYGEHTVTSVAETRTFDIPWMVMDSSRAKSVWGWEPTTRLEEILDEIARHGEEHPGWLELSEG